MQGNITKSIFNLINKIYDERQVLEEICLIFSAEMDCFVYILDKSGNPLFKEEIMTNSTSTHSSYEIFEQLTYGIESIGFVTIKRQSCPFNDFEEQAFYAFASVISLLMRFFNEQNKENIERVKSAVSSLSYSELTAALNVFEVLDYKSGHFIAGAISKEAGVSKSAIVNCLKKLESAGLIEVRSLGVKGTHVRILNEALIIEFGKLK